MTVTVISGSAPETQVGTRAPTIWGCTPEQVHDRFWAAFGVQVVRRNERSEIVAGAELFLLCDPGTLVLFRVSHSLDTLHWLDPALLFLRARDKRPRAYREVAVTEDDRLVRFERIYRDERTKSGRAALTRDPEIAKSWQSAPTVTHPWRWLRSLVGREALAVQAIQARVYDRRDDAQLAECVRDVVRYWKRPDATIGRATRRRGPAVADPTAKIEGAVFHGPVWIGAGRTVEPGTHVVGPTVLWDDPNLRPHLDEVKWLDIEPGALATNLGRNVRPRGVPGKRAFDVVFALCALILTAPLYPVVALAILIEDGRPIFFAHRRETVGGKEFGCLKFRSMRKDSAEAKAAIEEHNQADGPQFFMKEDPRVTRVGRVIRKLQIDELPQFVNVLVGHMSVVGPRPSPFAENQFCPAWREARLGVRPGVTGLWQVSRTRRRGFDFQEWIRFDLEYVERASWKLDMQILWETVRIVLAGAL